MATTSRTVITNETLCKALLITSLLTEDAEQSESALLSVIASSDPEETSEHEFILRSAAIALAAQPRARLRVPLKVPAELADLLRLPQSNRHCFVLRIMAGMSREECSRVLNLDVPSVDEKTTLAAVELSQLILREESPWDYSPVRAASEGNGLNPTTFVPSPAVSELRSHN